MDTNFAFSPQVFTQRFVQDDCVLDLIQDIVKPGIAIYSTKLTAKLPQSTDICHWHQDYNAHAHAYALSDTRTGGDASG